MKKGDKFYLLEPPNSAGRALKFRSKEDLMVYLNTSDKPVSEIVAVQIIERYVVQRSVTLLTRVDDEEVKPKMEKKLCIDIRCLDGDDHYREDCPHKDESTLCEDEQ